MTDPRVMRDDLGAIEKWYRDRDCGDPAEDAAHAQIVLALIAVDKRIEEVEAGDLLDSLDQGGMPPTSRRPVTVKVQNRFRAKPSGSSASEPEDGWCKDMDEPCHLEGCPSCGPESEPGLTEDEVVDAMPAIKRSLARHKLLREAMDPSEPYKDLSCLGCIRPQSIYGHTCKALGGKGEPEKEKCLGCVNWGLMKDHTCLDALGADFWAKVLPPKIVEHFKKKSK